MSKFSQEQIDHMRQLFTYCDKDGSGAIDAEELGSVMHEMGRDLSPEELQDLMNQLDADGNGSVEFDEFLEGMGKWFLGDPAGEAAKEDAEDEEFVEKARAIFDAVDTDGSGLIDASELKEALKGMGRDATDADVAALMKKLNVIGSEIDFDTFCRGFKDFASGGDDASSSGEPSHSFSEEQVQQYREIFRLFDMDGSGTIDIQEMRSVLNELGKKVDNHELEKLMNDLDDDGSGEIDFEEFLSGMERLDKLATAPDVFQTEDEDGRGKHKDYEKLANELKEVKKQLRIAQNKNQVFQNEVQYFEGLNQKQLEELQKKTQELDRIRKDYKSSQSLKEANKELMAEVESLRAQLQKARDQEDKIKRKNNTLNSTIQMERETSAVTKSQLEAKAEELEKIRSLVKSMSKMHASNDELEEQKKKNTFQEIELIQLREQMASFRALQDAHRHLQEQHCEYQTLLDQARSKINSLENTIDDLMQQSHTQAIASSVPSADMFSLANEMSQQKALETGRVDVVEAELKSAKVELTRMREEKNMADSEVIRVEGELKNMRVEVLRLREDKANKEGEVNMIRAEVTVLREEKKVREEEAAKAKRDHAEREGVLAMLESELVGLRKDKQVLEARVATLEARVRELEQLLADREEELRALRGQLQEEIQAREEVERAKKELIEKNLRLTNELSDLNDMTASFVSSSQEVLTDEDNVFVSYVNEALKDDATVSHLLPIGQRYADVSAAFADGVILSKLINKSVPGTIDERVLKLRPRSKVDITQNHNLCINSAVAIGCNVVNTLSQNLIDGQVPPVISFLSEVVKVGLLSNVSVAHCRELVQLKEESESMKQFMNLLPEQLLFRWVNYHLKRADKALNVKPLTNLTDDIRDGVRYTVLLHQLFPEQCSLDPLSESDPAARVAKVLANAAKVTTPVFMTPNAVLEANPKLNLFFVASLFKTKPGMAPLKQEDTKKVMEEVVFDSEGTREERAFRFWMQSLGVSVRNIVDDVGDGLAILQVLDKISPGIVDWKAVNTNKARMNAFNKLENCNYCVKLAKQLNFSMVGIGGKDFVDGNRKLILALVWQTMRHHIFSLLKQLKFGGKDVTEDAMIAWANNKVKGSGKSTAIKDLHDKRLGDGLYLVDLLAALDPTLVDYALVTPGDTPDNKMLNAKYAINVARQMGCCVFLLWEDIVEVNSKMLLTFVGALMSVDH